MEKIERKIVELLIPFQFLDFSTHETSNISRTPTYKLQSRVDIEKIWFLFIEYTLLTLFQKSNIFELLQVKYVVEVIFSFFVFVFPFL